MSIVSNKPFPDESNRADIERMLLHAFEFAVESGLISPENLQVEEMPVAGFGLPVVTISGVNRQGAGARNEAGS